METIETIMKFEGVSKAMKAALINNTIEHAPVDYTLKNVGSTVIVIGSSQRAWCLMLDGNKLKKYNICTDLNTLMLILHQSPTIEIDNDELIAYVITETAGPVYYSKNIKTDNDREFYFRISGNKRIPAYYYRKQDHPYVLVQSPNGKYAPISRNTIILDADHNWTGIRVPTIDVHSIYQKNLNLGLQIVTEIIVAAHNLGDVTSLDIHDPTSFNCCVTLNGVKYKFDYKTSELCAVSPTPKTSQYVEILNKNSIHTFKREMSARFLESAPYNMVKLSAKPNKICNDWLIDNCNKHGMTYDQETLTITWPE